MATKNDEPWLSYGVMGGFMQAQGHLQVLSNMGPQHAIDALRFSVSFDGDVTLGEGVDPAVIKGLEDKGHTVSLMEGYSRVTMGGV